MNYTNLEEIRNKIMTGLENEFTEALVPVNLTEDKDHGVSILNMLLSGSDEAMGNASGEFFFLPTTPGDEVQYFINLITLYESVPEENLNELCVAIAGINTYVTTGAFAVDFGSGSLIYKNVCAMSVKDSEDAIRESVDLSMGCAFQAISDFGYILTEVCEGERDAESAIGVFASES